MSETKRNVELDFRHRHYAHCESGVTASMLNHHGLEISEAMVFGIGSGLYFVHMPFIKIYDMPLTGFRNYVGGIIKRVARRLGIEFKFQTFRRPDTAMKALDEALERELPVGLRTGMYWLPYFPAAFRFHFNGHNIIVYGRRNGDYLISDPVLDQPAVCAYEDLKKARYAQGTLAPKGTMYYPVKVPKSPDLKKPVIQGIKEICKNMTRPFPNFIGVRGMRTLAGKIPDWPKKMGPEAARQYLAMIVRMQEEIGTGGGGFRFMFASFLEEASTILERDDLIEYAQRMTKVGDNLRMFALKSARICRGKTDGQDKYEEVRELLMDCANQEEEIYLALVRAGL